MTKEEAIAFLEDEIWSAIIKRAECLDDDNMYMARQHLDRIDALVEIKKMVRTSGL